MKAKGIFVSISLLIAGATLFGQQAQESVMTADDQALANTPRLILPASYGSRPLLYKKDNTRTIYFSGIYNQWVWNCNQAGSIWTMFTYEINYLRSLDASLPANKYSPMAVYNLLNYGNSTQGVSYFDSWRLVRANGIPGNADFDALDQNSQVWMTGYDKYYRGMKNRVDEVFAIDVGSPEGLLTLKHWLNDHLDGSQVGGLANFQIGSDQMVIPQIPLNKGLEEEGQYIVIKYGPEVGHCMTFAGWNDSIRFDVNVDGRYTNNIDINGDHVVDMKDWEIGALLVVNSWGTGFGNAGKLWVQYRLLAESTETGGIWNNDVMVVRPKKTYSPQLTVKAQIRYNHRSRLKIQVGLSTDVNALVPERVIDFPCFNFQGDTLPMQGFKGLNSDLIEIGLDITPLMNYFPANGQARIFLEVVQKSSTNTDHGSVESFSVMDYTNGTHEFFGTPASAPILSNTVTRLSAQVNTRLNRPTILTDQLPEAPVGFEYRAQIEADGTGGPYRFTNPAVTYFETPVASDLSFTGGASVFSEPLITARVMDLPFMFPFNGVNYNQITILKDGGFVMGQSLVTYPYVIDNRVRFYQNNGVFPFLSKLWYPDANSQVTFESSATAVIIRWHATADAAGKQPVEFAANIQPDGGIRFYYGSMTVSPDLAWIAGLSSGNNIDYFLPEQNTAGMKPNTAISLNHLNWPSWLSLGSNGDLQGTPMTPGTYTLPLRVTDGAGISNDKELTLKVTSGSGVPSESVGGKISIYPNPATDQVWLKGFSDQAGDLQFRLYNLTGSLVVSTHFQLNAGNFLIPVSETATLPTGVYLYRLNGVISDTGKIIRQ